MLQYHSVITKIFLFEFIIFFQGKELQSLFKKAEQMIKEKQEELLKAKEEYVKLNKSLKGRSNKLQVYDYQI